MGASRFGPLRGRRAERLLLLREQRSLPSHTVRRGLSGARLTAASCASTGMSVLLAVSTDLETFFDRDCGVTQRRLGLTATAIRSSRVLSLCATVIFRAVLTAFGSAPG